MPERFQIEQERERMWHHNQDSYNSIAERGFQAHMDAHRGVVSQAFSRNRSVPAMGGCIDDGILDNEVSIAGSGILIGHNRAVKIYGSLPNLEVITSHAGCGAAALWAEQNNDPRDPDEIGIEFAQQVAERLGLKHRHIEKLYRPHFHAARCAYIIANHLFQPGNGRAPEHLPIGFTINYRHVGADIACDELILATNIAYGDHGFGNRFARTGTKFHVFVIGDARDSAYKASNIAEEIRAMDDPRVEIHTFDPSRR